MTLYKRPFENIVGKVENAGNQPFLLFPKFSNFPEINFYSLVTLILSYANAFNLNQSKILSFSKDLTNNAVGWPFDTQKVEVWHKVSTQR